MVRVALWHQTLLGNNQSANRTQAPGLPVYIICNSDITDKVGTVLLFLDSPLHVTTTHGLRQQPKNMDVSDFARQVLKNRYIVEHPGKHMTPP